FRVDALPLPDLGLARDPGERHQVPGCGVPQEIDVLEHEHALDGGEHQALRASPSDSSSASTMGSFSRLASNIEGSTPGTARAACTAQARSQGSAASQASA